MAGLTATGPLSGLPAMVFVDPNPEAPAEVVSGNPGWPQPGAPGYWADPVRYPGRLYSVGYGENPVTPDPETDLIAAVTPVDVAGAPGPGTPYFDATPNTHAGPWPHPVIDGQRPDSAAFLAAQSAELHADGLDNNKPGTVIGALNDQWTEYYNGPVDGVMLTDPGQNKHVSAGWGSTDITADPANINATTDFPQHFHRRVAQGHNLPMDFLWMPGGQRPLISTVHGAQSLPTGQNGPYAGQDASYGYGSAGAVLTMPAGAYEAPAGPYQPAALSSQGLLEGPLLWRWMARSRSRCSASSRRRRR
jgi:hypothetical protein